MSIAGDRILVRIKKVLRSMQMDTIAQKEDISSEKNSGGVKS